MCSVDSFFYRKLWLTLAEDVSISAKRHLSFHIPYFVPLHMFLRNLRLEVNDLYLLVKILYIFGCVGIWNSIFWRKWCNQYNEEIYWNGYFMIGFREELLFHLRREFEETWKQIQVIFETIIITLNEINMKLSGNYFSTM